MIVTNTVKNAVFSLWAKKINPKFLNEFVNTFHLFTSSFVKKIIKIFRYFNKNRRFNL